ncbi:alpha/beta fold hydrolase [Ktedonosporobacter rubrisoli]|nr:alpha/beta hydrolase [Ktedonosporobacter rubrisoli]
MQCNLEDLSIFYETYGAGRPIIMLPGRPSDHNIMKRFMEPLFTEQDAWLRIYPDLPGTGLTPSLERLATHDQMIETMLAFIDAVIPGQRFILAGLSYGGYLARGVLAQRAASIDGLLLCAPQVKADPTQAQLPSRAIVVENPQLLTSASPHVAGLVEDLVVVQSEPVLEVMPIVLSEVIKADHAFNGRLEVAAPASFEVDPQQASFEAPTLILTARQDHLCGYRDAWNLLENFPRATFAVLDRAGHFVNIEQDELCRSLMREWLQRVKEYETR